MHKLLWGLNKQINYVVVPLFQTQTGHWAEFSLF